jgi:hypothetical protein
VGTLPGQTGDQRVRPGAAISHRNVKSSMLSDQLILMVTPAGWCAMAGKRGTRVGGPAWRTWEFATVPACRLCLTL